MNHIHQLALHRPRRSMRQRDNKQPIGTKSRTAPHIKQFPDHTILLRVNKRSRYSRTDQTLTLNLANRTKQAWPNKLGMRKGPDLLDLGEGELEGGIDPVQDLAPPHEIGAVHDPDARHRRRRHRLLPPSVASCETNFSKRLHAKRRRWAFASAPFICKV